MVMLTLILILVISKPILANRDDVQLNKSTTVKSQNGPATTNATRLPKSVIRDEEEIEPPDKRPENLRPASTSSISPTQIFCQTQNETPEEAITRQEQESRDVEKGVVGLEIAQGALEITLGAIRIAAAGTTAEVLRREDNIASSRMALGITGEPNTPPPVDILGPLREENSPGKNKRLCDEETHANPSCSNSDPFSRWNQGFSYRMKRSIPLSSVFRSGHILAPPPTPTPHPKTSTGKSVSMPSLDEAEKLLHLLEDLLDKNNQVLRILGIELPPITSSGSFLLSQYKEKVQRRKEMKVQYAIHGYMDDDWEDAELDGFSEKFVLGGPHWLQGKMERETPIKTFTDEIIRLKRIRRVYKAFHRRR